MESRDRTDRMLHANVEAFEAALAAGREKVVTPQWPKSCLAVLDGSNQDTTTLSLTASLATRHATNILITAGRFGADRAADEEAAIDQAISLLAGQGVAAEGVLSDLAESHDRILAVIDKRASEICLLPCPFSHDLDALARTTLGTVVEVCLARARVPVVIVRGPFEADTLLTRPHLVIRDADAVSAQATRLGLGLLTTGESPAGRLRISFVYAGEPGSDIDEAVAKGFRAAPGELIPLLSKGRSSFLHRLMLLRDASPGLHLETRLVQSDDQLIGQAAGGGQLHILPMPREAHGVSELVHEFVLSTLDPVMVLSGQ